MTTPLRTYLALLLSLMLVVTSHSMAVARGMPGPAGQMVICTGTGPVMISVDEDGQPTGPAHICPDAALSLIQVAFDSPPPAVARTLQTLRFVKAEPALSPGVYELAAQARAPPARA